MDEQSTNEATLIEPGKNQSKRARVNTEIMQNNSSSHNFVNLSINEASNKVERNSIEIFNSYGQSCKFITIFIFIF